MFNVTAVGNLAKDPEQKELSSGKKVTNFVLMTKGQDESTVMQCTVWGNRGDVIANYVKKGNQITVVGSGKLKIFERRDGSHGGCIEVNVDNFTLPSKSNSSYVVENKNSEAIPA